MSEYRHEWKHEISNLDRRVIRARMQAVARPDPHAVGGKYFIRSLYFDSPNDRALRDKMDGVSVREKFRIRYYNGDTSLIHLEKKGKWSSLGTKENAVLTVSQAESICSGIVGGQDLQWMRDDPQPLVRELYRKMLTEGLRPKVIVDYTREPFIYDPGNVRVTLDYDIRTGLRRTDFLNPDAVTVPAACDPIILEVKWDEYLPGIIRDAVSLPNRRAGAFSKYASCRMYE